jgi:hypothetical protein
MDLAGVCCLGTVGCIREPLAFTSFDDQLSHCCIFANPEDLEVFLELRINTYSQLSFACRHNIKSRLYELKINRTVYYVNKLI